MSGTKFGAGAVLIAVALACTAAQSSASTLERPAKVTTKLKLTVLDPGVENGFVAGTLSSPERACEKARPVDALALHGAGGGETKSLRDGRFQIPLGQSDEIPLTGGYEVTAPRRKVGSGNRATVCGETSANVRYKSVGLDRFDFDYVNSAFSGTLGSPEPECAGPNRYIEVTKFPSGDYVGSDYIDVNAGWTVAFPGAPTGEYMATVSGTFGSAQHVRKSGDLDIVNCEQVFTGTEVPGGKR